MNDVNTFKSLLDSAGLMSEESRTGASEGGLRTYLSVPLPGGIVLAQFSGQGKFVGFDVQWLTSPVEPDPPVPMLLNCPGILENGNVCGARHIDRGEFATRVHHTHACQRCGHVWRPAVVPTVGVEFLPGYKNEPV